MSIYTFSNQTGPLLLSQLDANFAVGGAYTPSGTGAVATTVAIELGHSICFEDFGAVGNGITDDTAAIQNCLNAAIANNVPIRLLPKTYASSSARPSVTLSANQSLIIEGNGAVIATLITDAGVYYTPYLGVTGVSNNLVSIKNLYITSSLSGASSTQYTRLRGYMLGLGIQQIANLVLDNVNVSGFPSINIWLYNCQQGEVNNCSGINGSAAGLFIQSCFDINVNGGTYNYNGGNNGGTIEGYGITCATKKNTSDNDNARIKINGATCINNTGKGIDAHNCLEFTVTNNTIRGMTFNGIFAVNQGAPSSNVSDVVIANNDIDGTTTGTTTNNCYGIQAGSSGTSSYTGSVVITGNKIRNCNGISSSGTTGIWVGNASTGGTSPTTVIVSNNTLYNSSDGTGSTINISPVTASAVAIGAATISGNLIQETVSDINGILCGSGQVSQLTIVGNTLNTTSSFTNGISPGATNTVSIAGNILNGTFNTAAIVTSTTLYQTTNGNILNGVVMPNIFNYNQSVSWQGAAPSTGTYFQSSVVWNNGATVGQPKGWMCTVSGTPGTWVSMGNL